MRVFNFWQKWLVFFGIVSAMFGIFLMSPAMFNTDIKYISSAFWDSGVAPVEVKVFYNWVFGVYAAMEISWALFIVLVASYPFNRKEKWSWYCLFSCISVWFVIDTSFSLYCEFYVNAVNNFFFYIFLMLPLIFTKKEFF